MTSKKPPLTYDEITRKTVPEPDSSFRPSPEQVRQAYAGFRKLDANEQALHDRVAAAIGRASVTIDVVGDTVTLGGTAPSDAMTQIVDRARAVDGVGSVIDKLVVG